jgi:hypothetical protein
MPWFWMISFRELEILLGFPTPPHPLICRRPESIEKTSVERRFFEGFVISYEAQSLSCPIDGLAIVGVVVSNASKAND